MSQEPDLFRRHPSNPILGIHQLPYRANSIFNPGAARVGGAMEPRGGERVSVDCDGGG